MVLCAASFAASQSLFVDRESDALEVNNATDTPAPGSGGSVSSTRFCTTSADCRENGDTAATCNSRSRCECSSGFSSRAFSGHTYYKCYATGAAPTSFRFHFRFAFRAGICARLRNSTIMNLLLNIIAALLGVDAADMISSSLCGSLYLNVDATVPTTIGSALETIETDVLTQIKASGSTELIAASGDEVTVSSSLSTDDCFVQNAVEATLLGPDGAQTCVATKCSTGFTLTTTGTDASKCEADDTSRDIITVPVESTEDDDDLPPGAFAGIIIGAYLCAMIVTGLICFCVRKKQPAEQQQTKEAPQTQPFDDQSRDFEQEAGVEYSDVLV